MLVTASDVVGIFTVLVGAVARANNNCNKLTKHLVLNSQALLDMPEIILAKYG